MDGVASALIIEVAKVCLRLSSAHDESLLFCRLVERVDLDLQEASRLRQYPAICSQLKLDPGDKTYIDGAIETTRKALEDIGIFVGNIRLEKDTTGKISIATRANWVISHHKQLASRQYELDACHKSLMHALTRMQGWREKVALSFKIEVGQHEELQEEGWLFSPYRHRQARTGVLRRPGLAITTHGNKAVRNSMSAIFLQVRGP
jgi:hypothetical protein